LVIISFFKIKFGDKNGLSRKLDTMLYYVDIRIFNNDDWSFRLVSRWKNLIKREILNTHVLFFMTSSKRQGLHFIQQLKGVIIEIGPIIEHT
jgi:hypothetical protein